jgi:hypothetical protein
MRAVINISVRYTKSLVAEIDRLHRRNEECERRNRIHARIARAQFGYQFRARIKAIAFQRQ